MNHKAKDPRQTTVFLGRISLLMFFFIPFVYITIRTKNILNLIIILIGIIIFGIVQRKRINNLESATILGYFFSGTWLFIGIVFLTSTHPENYNLIFWALISLFIFFSIILLYFSEKSAQYEKYNLKTKRKFNPRILFLILLLFSTLRIIFFFL